MKVALLGGSFDPPHLAHQQILEHLLNSQNFEEAWVVPSKKNPFKDSDTSFEDRVKMCHLAFDGLDPRIKVCEEEAGLSGYTIDLVKHLQNKFPDHQFSFVVGSDLKAQIDKWKDSPTLKKLIPFVFLPRPPEKDSPFLPFSSTAIRVKVQNGYSIDDEVSKPVINFINQNKLYQQKSKTP